MSHGARSLYSDARGGYDHRRAGRGRSGRASSTPGPRRGQGLKSRSVPPNVLLRACSSSSSMQARVASVSLVTWNAAPHTRASAANLNQLGGLVQSIVDRTCVNFRPHAAFTMNPNNGLDLGVDGFVLTFDGSSSTDRETASGPERHHARRAARGHLADRRAEGLTRLTSLADPRSRSCGSRRSGGGRASRCTRPCIASPYRSSGAGRPGPPRGRFGGAAVWRLQPVSKTSPRTGPSRGLAGRRNRSEPLFGSAQPNCRGWVGF